MERVEKPTALKSESASGKTPTTKIYYFMFDLICYVYQHFYFYIIVFTSKLQVFSTDMSSICLYMFIYVYIYRKYTESHRITQNINICNKYTNNTKLHFRISHFQQTTYIQKLLIQTN